MTFRDVMAEALYHPEHGYYTTGRPWQGEGDFTTAPRYGEAFALGIARFAAKARDAMGPGAFEVVEVGSGSGELAAQLHKLLAEHGVRVRSVERQRPPRLPKEVPWSASLRGLKLRGLVVSNELFDALPVHRVTMAPDGLREAWVGLEGDRLRFELGPLAGREVQGYLERFGLVPEEGAWAEVGLDALTMLREMALALREGAVLTFDYGDTAAGLRARPQGTLAATRAHRLQPDPLTALGEQDLTAHVNLTALRAHGEALGLATLAEVPQWAFLGAMGVLEHISRGLQDPAAWREALAAKTLVAPGRMGDFRVLAQAKGLDEAARQRLARALEAPA